ncbi:MAG: hypothetical protein ABIF28_12285 [Pseudomonadota bacterium]|uniref:hypothetical protein n=1 Tax=Methyloversatilis sp. TaxID=2569862 RepID=UPI002734D5E1|nr:hypothetical protein [Methyloversatilis sp.]MDP3873412.1 hypothetical protein [Methyloversatilis sp.]
MAKLSRCPHCGQDTIARLVKLMARAKAPAICPACGGRSCTGITPLSLLSFFVLILVCGTLLRAAGRLGNRWTLLGVLALFIGGFLYISFHTGLVKLERYPMQRNIAIGVVALLAIGFSWWWFSRGTAS